MSDPKLVQGQLLRVLQDNGGPTRPVTPPVAIYLGPEKDYLPASADNPEVALAPMPHAVGVDVGRTVDWSIVHLDKLSFLPAAGVADKVVIDGIEGFTLSERWTGGRVAPVVLRWDDGGWRECRDRAEAEAVVADRRVVRMVALDERGRPIR